MSTIEQESLFASAATLVADLSALLTPRTQAPTPRDFESLREVSRGCRALTARFEETAERVKEVAASHLQDVSDEVLAAQVSSLGLTEADLAIVMQKLLTEDASGTSYNLVLLASYTGDAGRLLIPALSEILSSKEPRSSEYAALLLMKLKPSVIPVEPTARLLIECFEVSDALDGYRFNPQGRAVQAVARIPFALTGPLLAHALSSSAGDATRRGALCVLEALGEEARGLEPQVKALLNDRDENVRRQARKTLTKIAPTPVSSRPDKPLWRRVTGF